MNPQIPETPDKDQSQTPEQAEAPRDPAPAPMAAPVPDAPALPPASDIATDDTNVSDEEFDALLEQYDQLGEVGSGDLVQGTIVSITSGSVLVDLGDKTEGVVPIQEFQDHQGNMTQCIGDKVDVLVLRRDSDTGQVTASRQKAVIQAALAQLEAAMAGDDPLTGKIVRVVKNGVIVDLGIECFMPASHLDIRRVGDLEAWIGRDVDVMVLELHRGRKRAVVSRRAQMERQQTEERAKFFASTEVGATVTGKVKNITEFGIFIDLGGFDGLIPRDEISWERGLSPGDLCSAGDDVEVLVTSMDPERGKISLSRRRTKPDPWATIQERYHASDVVDGVIVNLTNYGAFVRIEEGLTGLIHASDMSWSSGRKRPQDFVNVGDSVKAQILEIDPSKRRLSLGLKQIAPDPWAAIEKDYPVGSKVKGKVTSVTNFGIFVELGPETEGLVHQSDLTWERKSIDPKSVAKVGDEIEVVVLKIDRVNRKISLGHKQLTQSPYVAFAKSHPVSSHVSGKVTRIVSFGAFVEVAPGVEGLVHISHIEEGRVEKVEDVLKIGEEIQVKVLKIDPKSEKINLSRRGYLRDVERREIAQYAPSKIHGGANLGEAFKLAGLKISDGAEDAPSSTGDGEQS